MEEDDIVRKAAQKHKVCTMQSLDGKSEKGGLKTQGLHHASLTLKDVTVVCTH